jgi:CheY-like chemotaxis protein
LSSGALIGEEQRRELGLKHSLLKPVRQSQLFDAISDSFSTSNTKKPTLLSTEAHYADYHDRKILVVEDNKVNQKVLLGILAKFKIKPAVADNGKIALGMLANNVYDLIFMDCQMPILDGYEATAAIRKMEQEQGSARQVVVALTAHAIAGEREKCVAAGMDDYLSKPIRRDQLATVMAHWLEKGENSDSTVTPIPAGNLNKPTQPTDSDIWNETATLKHLDNDKELLVDMILLFREEMPEMISKLKTTENQGDLLELSNVAHAIKGSVGHFCSDAIIQIAASLEHSARNGEAVDYPSMIDGLISEVGHLMASLGHYADAYNNHG